MESAALTALHIAAGAIRKMKGIKEATADNDNTSGEVHFKTTSGRGYVLRLDEYKES